MTDPQGTHSHEPTLNPADDVAPGGDGAGQEPPKDQDAAATPPSRMPGKATGRAGNFLKSAWNGKGRPYFFVLGAALLVVGILVYDKLTTPGGTMPAPVSSAPSMPHATPMPGAATNPYVARTLNGYNAARGAQAAQHGASYFPVMGPLAPVHPVNVAPNISEQANQPLSSPPQLHAVEYGAYPDREGMEKEIAAIIKGSAPVVALTANVHGAIPGLPGAPTTSASAMGSTTVAAGGPMMAQPPKGPVLANPGHISFAVLDTSVKSTEPGPVMATIETGRFSGARLLGGFAQHGGRVAIEFNEMTWNGRSYGIQAVAITTQTARTALSTYTNYHVLYRYGWLVGSALLEGVSNALQSANTSTYITGSGLAVATQQLSNGQVAASAIGNVGSVLAPIMAQRFNTPPTVHVAAGTGIGILFMSPVQQGTKVSAAAGATGAQQPAGAAPVNLP